MSEPHTLAEITIELFQRLDAEGLSYAVLRNYERLPQFSSDQDHAYTDVDLVMPVEDVPAWRKLAVSLAADCGWDVLTECSHFGVSRVPEHRIDIFRFYRLSPPACLQVDIFHGFLLWGVPFSSEQALLDGRIADRELGLTRISRSSENVFRMLQLHSLLPDGASPEKIGRYRGKVLSHYASEGATFRGELRDSFGIRGERALDALIHGDLARFQRQMTLAKAHFLARFVMRNPRRIAWFFRERMRDHWLRFIKQQCGFVLPIHASDPRDHALVRDALDELKQKKILPAWTMRGAGSSPSVTKQSASKISWAEHRVMERGGIAVKWSEAGAGSLDVSHVESSEDVLALLFPLLIERHPALFVRS